VDAAAFSLVENEPPLPFCDEPGGLIQVSTLAPEFGGGQIPRWQIPKTRIVVGGSVTSAADWASLEALGVTHCINVTDPPDVGVPADRSLHAPISDDGNPFPHGHIQHVVDFARSALAGGGKLYLHCWVGASRSPSFAYAVLRSVYGAASAEAIASIQAAYPWGQPYGSDPKHQSYIKAIESWHVGAEPRNPKRLIYSSSPDRGLQTLLEMWPAILAEEPEAELHIAYGMENWRKSIDMGLRVEIPWLSAEAYRQIQHMIKTLPRVISHGRLGPTKLAELQLSSGVYAYPTWFAETSCITMMQAQAAGCYIVATPNAALNETVADRGILVPGAWERGEVAGDPERAEFVRRVVNAIRGIEQPKTREELQAYAREHFDLDSLARDWDKMLREELTGAEDRVVPEWRE